MSIVDKLSHLNSLNNRLGSYEERLSALVAAIGGHYPIATPEGGRGSNLTQTALTPAVGDNDSLLETFEGSNRFALFVLDRIEQHLAHLQQYVHGEQRLDTAKGRADSAADYAERPLGYVDQLPGTISIGGATYTRL